MHFVKQTLNLQHENDDFVAQLVEQQTLNLWVQGSKPCGVTKLKTTITKSVCGFLFIIMIIRQEQRKDWVKVNELIVNDRDEFQISSTFLDQFKRSEYYLPDLALVAEYKGKILGYVLLVEVELTSKQNVNALYLMFLSENYATEESQTKHRILDTVLKMSKVLGYSLVISPYRISRESFDYRQVPIISDNYNLPINSYYFLDDKLDKNIDYSFSFTDSVAEML